LIAKDIAPLIEVDEKVINDSDGYKILARLLQDSLSFGLK
jgi:hypothetical protein